MNTEDKCAIVREKDRFLWQQHGLVHTAMVRRLHITVIP